MWALVEENSGLVLLLLALVAALVEIGIEGWNRLSNGAIWPIRD
ncbi:MAG: hypothetical protein ACE147_02800 [Candidatus Methylomirabilales bacterium]